ncbi:unannotated protein [freshwater metagenome]|uniref:Unannotated protein n=1 Tax=freshwater metagenome TaxID=449393 RepID=A0A6J5ZTG3_9ZZZZ
MLFASTAVGMANFGVNVTWISAVLPFSLSSAPAACEAGEEGIGLTTVSTSGDFFATATAEAIAALFAGLVSGPLLAEWTTIELVGFSSEGSFAVSSSVTLLLGVLGSFTEFEETIPPLLLTQLASATTTTSQATITIQ